MTPYKQSSNRWYSQQLIFARRQGLFNLPTNRSPLLLSLHHFFCFRTNFLFQVKDGCFTFDCYSYNNQKMGSIEFPICQQFRKSKRTLEIHWIPAQKAFIRDELSVASKGSPGLARSSSLLMNFSWAAPARAAAHYTASRSAQKEKINEKTGWITATTVIRRASCFERLTWYYLKPKRARNTGILTSL